MSPQSLPVNNVHDCDYLLACSVYEHLNEDVCFIYMNCIWFS